LIAIAQEKGAVRGRKMGVDTTVVETNIHYPTDSSLLGDGAQVLTRTMKRMEKRAGKLKRKVRDRTRSVNKRVRAIAIAGVQFDDRTVSGNLDLRDRISHANLMPQGRLFRLRAFLCQNSTLDISPRTILCIPIWFTTSCRK
jgi:hypothetical protein